MTMLSSTSWRSSREDKKKPHEALKRLQRVKVAMADPEEAGLPWYRFPVNAPGRMSQMFHVQFAKFHAIKHRTYIIIYPYHSIPHSITLR